MATELVHIGFGNILAINRLVALTPSNSAPTRRLIQEAREKGLRPCNPGGPHSRDHRRKGMAYSEWLSCVGRMLERIG